MDEYNSNQADKLVQEEEYPTQEEINNNINNQNTNDISSQDYCPPPNAQNMPSQEYFNKPNENQTNEGSYPLPPPFNDQIINCNMTPNSQQVPQPIPSGNNIIEPVPIPVSQPVIVQPANVQPVVTPVSQPVIVQPVAIPVSQPMVQPQPIIINQPVKHIYVDDEEERRRRRRQQEDAETCGQICQILCICLYCFALLAGGR